MSNSPGNRDATEMRPDDDSGRYWSAPPCRVRVDDGSRVIWIDLKRPYALIGSHRCCTLRIRGAHIPEIAYFACCLRDRVEIWPTAAIAFPRWGAIAPDLQVVVGPCSLTFHPSDIPAATSQSLPYLADSEIETRMTWPGQDFIKMFRRPVTIIGDDHPSVLRLHGRGLSFCHYAAVVQDQSFWLVDLSAKRMQRSERVRRIHSPGETCQLGDATIELISTRPLLADGDRHSADSAIGIGTEASDDNVDSDSDIHSGSDLHSDGDLHSDHGASGISQIASAIQSFDPDPSLSLISSKPPQTSSTQPKPSKQSPAGDDTNSGDSRSKRADGNDLGDDADAALCLNEGRNQRSRSVGKSELEGQVDSLAGDGDDDSTDELDIVVHRVDAKKHAAPRPSAPKPEIALPNDDDESSTSAALSLVDTALGLVDAAVHESDSVDATGTVPRPDASADPKSTHSPTNDRSTHELDDDEPNSHCLDLASESAGLHPYDSSDVALTGHDPPTLIDRCETGSLESTASIDGSTVNESSQQPNDAELHADEQMVPVENNWIFDEFDFLKDQEPIAGPGQSQIGSVDDEHEELASPQELASPRDAAADLDSEPPHGTNQRDVASDEDSQHSESSQHNEIKDLVFADDPSLGFIPHDSEESEPNSNESSELLASDSLTEGNLESDSLMTEPLAEIDEAGPSSVEESLDTNIVPTDSTSLATPDESPIALFDAIQNADQPLNVETNVVEPDAEHLSSVSPMQPAMIPTAIQTEPPESDRPNESQAMSLAAAAVVTSSKSSLPRPARPQNAAAIDAEALTSHITSRLSEIGKSRSLLQQLIRWFAITAGIIVPATVVAWVVHRLYSDWY